MKEVGDVEILPIIIFWCKTLNELGKRKMITNYMIGIK
jgi:hypothetical protein